MKRRTFPLTPAGRFWLAYGVLLACIAFALVSH